MGKKITSKKLLQYKEEKKNLLVDYVINDIIDNSSDYDSTDNYIKNVLHGGCQSGIVSSLIYTYETLEFYEKYEPQIWDLLVEQSEGSGETMGAIIDLIGADCLINFKNNLAWYGYEETMRQIAQYFNLEY